MLEQSSAPPLYPDYCSLYANGGSGPLALNGSMLTPLQGERGSVRAPLAALLALEELRPAGVRRRSDPQRAAERQDAGDAAAETHRHPDGGNTHTTERTHTHH